MKIKSGIDMIWRESLKKVKDVWIKVNRVKNIHKIYKSFFSDVMDVIEIIFTPIFKNI